MELKPSLQDYREPEFLELVQSIFDVNLHKENHDKFVNHFDSIAGHPAGANIIFYPQKVTNLSIPDAASVVYLVKSWHTQQGKPCFKGDVTVNPVAEPSYKPSDPRYKTQNSQRELKQVLQLERNINATKNAVEAALVEQLQLIQKTTTYLSANAENEPKSARLSALRDTTEQLDLVQHRANRAIAQYKYFEMGVRFTNNHAQMRLSNPFFDRSLEEVTLQKAIQISNQYTNPVADFNQRHKALHLQTENLLDRIEVLLIRLNARIGTGPTADSRSFDDLLAESQIYPSALVLATNTKAPFELDRMSVLKGLRSAVAEFTWMSDADNEERAGKYADILLFASASREGERFAVSVPLSELMPIEGRDWQDLANTAQEIDVPFRIGTGVATRGVGTSYVGLKEVTAFSRIYVTPTQGTSLPSSVKVKAAAWDNELDAYRLTIQGVAPTTVLWKSEDVSTTHSRIMPVQAALLPNRLNSVQSAEVPVIKTFSTGEEVHFDDYIVTFPADSGLAPLYLTLKDRREYPGVASGNGQSIEGAWFSGDLSEAAVPSQIAGILRGQVFRNFGAFRDAFWMAVAANPSLSEAFNSEDLVIMATDRPPRAPRIVKSGQQRSVEIRHVSAIKHEGGVYDMDNMRVVVLV